MLGGEKLVIEFLFFVNRVIVKGIVNNNVSSYIFEVQRQVQTRDTIALTNVKYVYHELNSIQQKSFLSKDLTPNSQGLNFTRIQMFGFSLCR